MTTAITELQTLPWYQQNNFIVLTLDKADTLNFSYLCINCSLNCCSLCVNLYKHTSKVFRNVYYFRIDFFAFSLCLRLSLPDSDYLTALFFSHPAIADSRYCGLHFIITKLRPEGVRYIESWLHVTTKMDRSRAWLNRLFVKCKFGSWWSDRCALYALYEMACGTC